MKVITVLVIVILALFFLHYLLNLQSFQQNKVDAEKYRSLEKFEIGNLQIFWRYDESIETLLPEILKKISDTIRDFGMNFYGAIWTACRSNDSRYIDLYRAVMLRKYDEAGFLQRQMEGGSIGPVIKD